MYNFHKIAMLDKDTSDMYPCPTCPCNIDEMLSLLVELAIAMVCNKGVVVVICIER